MTRTAVAVRRLPLLGLGALALLAGLAGGMALLGLPLDPATLRLAGAHGVLMTLGFLGTLIALERAVALGRPWGYLAPVAAGLGGLALVMGLPPVVAAALLAIAGAVYVAVYLAFDRIERSLHTGVQAMGAVAWLVAGLSLLAGRSVALAVPWLAAFLVLTIVGERLELSRIARSSRGAQKVFVAVVGMFSAGILITLVDLDLGMRVAGLGMLGLALWLARHDIARRTVRTPGVTRFIALCLLSGYVWLAASGTAWLVAAGARTGSGYDAMLHTLFLGFVVSMVFGHAPVILPAVLRVPLPYRPWFYGHLVLLEAGLVLRVIGGDVAGSRAAWQLGGMLNVLAMLLFVGASGTSTILALRERASLGRGRPAMAAGAPSTASGSPRAPGHRDGRPEPAPGSTPRATPDTSRVS